ncbi:DNA cytosine methyltransferase [uncultured Bacteroides sp.]|uniref:DNA cytosine methyltransferase n=1 Tax=uncultured Bacteroides sp. TaxID=162156 RepID=UPI0025D18D1B|nr:DNA cytosine methyltransferase [uncultured Bacteroides sp.]
MKLVHGSLFSGFDAPSVAASWMGWKNAFHCEINDFCNKILKYWFPNSEHYEDITKTDFRQWRGRIDVLTGGFPCQPFSVAGQRRGADDNRYLWPHMLRAIREIRPTWVIGENVAGILTMVQPGEETEMGIQTSLFGEDNRKRILLRQEYVVETICKDLEREGYSVQPILIPACAVGAPHRRDRMWFVAHRNNVTDSDICSDIGVSREDASPCRKKWLQERNEIWKPDKSDNVRSEIQRPSSNSQCPGSGQIHEEVQPEEPDGDCVDCNGYEWDATNSNSEKLQEWLKTGRRSNEAENRARMDNGIERFGSLRYAPYSYNKRLQGCINFGSVGKEKKKSSYEQFSGSLSPDWKNFPTQSPVCRGNDGLPFNVDDLTIPFTKWRQESVKGYGNAIVPQVILEIFKAIEEVEQ